MLASYYKVVVAVFTCVVLPGLRHSQGVVLDGEVVWESKIISDLVLNNTGYVREARPATSANQSVDIAVYPIFIRIEEINEAANSFTATLIMMQVWTDVRLAWNASHYGGVDTVRLPSAKLWLPDIVPYNTAASGSHNALYEETVWVKNTGRIEWLPLMTVTAECSVDVTNFPFDSQLCTIYFGSWIHTVKEMAIKFHGTDKKELDISVTDVGSVLPVVEHPYWDLKDGKVQAKIIDLKYGESKFNVIGVTAHVKRRASFYKYLAIGPGALIGFLVPVLFLLPARSNEKNTFGMLMMLGLILLISVLADAIPLNHGSTPRVGVFYLTTLVLISFSIILSILVSNISLKGARRRALPQWIHRAFLSRNGLRRILCIDRYSPVDNLFAETMREIEDHSEPAVHVEPDVPGAQEMENVGKLESQIRDSNKYLRYICGKMSAEDSYKNVNSDWEEFARVIDRVLFVIFFILYALTAVGLLT